MSFGRPWLAWLWLLGFVAAPLVMLGVVALSVPADGIPPFRPAVSMEGLEGLADPLFLDGLIGSLRISLTTSMLCLLIGYPMTLGIVRSKRPAFWLGLLLVPFWSGFLMRLTAWTLLLRELNVLHTELAMQIGMVSCYLPFLILPLQSRMAAADPLLAQAAADLGASPFRVFLHITLPHSLPGVVAGVVLVFVPVMGEYVIPELLGDPGAQTFGRMIWDAFFSERDWPLAASLSLALLVILVPPALLLRRR
jgi:putrescine transport system permease protein